MTRGAGSPPAMPRDESVVKPLQQLSALQPGSRATIRRIEAGRGLAARLSAMGLLPGAQVEVLKSGRGGPLVIKIKETKLVLGRGMTHKIIVE